MMRKKKIPPKVGKHPTMIVNCCAKCNAEVRKFNWGGIKGWKCQGCGMLYASTENKLGSNFVTYGPD